MAKKSQPATAAKRGRGRPASDQPLDERVLVRMEKGLKDALEEYSRREGHNAVATSMRVIAVKEMRALGLLKDEGDARTTKAK